jgi:flagellar motor switch protein FliM
MSRLLTPEEIEALRADLPFIPSPRERFHIVVDAGHADLEPEQVEGLKPGDVIALDRHVEGVVEIVANAVTVAYGTLVDLDGRAAVRVVSLSTTSKRISSPSRHNSGGNRP